ncbi:MAG: hypothetical protein QE290_20405 [Acidovorax sp.]|jgi:hypothetical protein|uniref:hypothetical protein n=1 Tax=Acidovorax sp. TaxID=1872122 RepID=UPI002627EC77|nr:hypothetical protein [Acidovorax sp.]MDH4466401.1 hypothetical protein [Acidovorax sp.]
MALLLVGGALSGRWNTEFWSNRPVVDDLIASVAINYIAFDPNLRVRQLVAPNLRGDASFGLQPEGWLPTAKANANAKADV